MATFSNSDPYLAIERALRAARRPSDEGPRARAMWDQYQADREPYGNRPWRPTPGPVITEREVEAVADELGVSDEEAAELIRQTAQAATSDASDAGWMAEGLAQYGMLNAAMQQAPTLQAVFSTFSKAFAPETWSTPEKATPEKAALTPATPPPAYEPPAPIAALPPAQQLSLEELGAEMGRAQMAAASYNPRGVEAEETTGPEPTAPPAAPPSLDPAAVAENARQAAIEQSIEQATQFTANQARIAEMFTQPQSLLALLEPLAPAQPAAPASARDPSLGRTPGFASRGLAAAAIDPEEVGIPGPDIEGGRLAGLAAGVGLPSLAYNPQSPAFDLEVETPGISYAPQSPSFANEVETPDLAYNPQIPAFPEENPVEVPTPSISYNPQAPGVPGVETPELSYNPQIPALPPAVEVPTPEISYNPQPPAVPEIETPEISYNPVAPGIPSLDRLRAIAELEQALSPPTGRYAALTPPTIADVPAISAPVGPAIGTGNWNEFNPSPTVTRAYDPVGSVSAKQESSGKGVGFISHGRGDPGGQSYGVHQLSSRYSMGAFLRSREGAKYAPMFAGLRPGTPAFNQAYKAAVAADPKGMQKAQYDFYTRTHYQPVVEMARKAGFNVNDRGVQEALFSQAIQHSGRGNQSIINAAARGGVGGSAEQQIRKLYNARARYAAQVRMPADWQRGVQQRYVREVEDAVRASRQGNATNSAAGGGFDDTSSALGGYTEITGPRTRASLGIPGIINTLLGIPSAAAASAPAQDAPVGFGATTFLPPPTPAAMAPSTPSTASSGLGASQGGQSSAQGQSSASSSQTSSQASAQAAAAQSAGLGAMASAPAASASQAQSQAQAAAKSEEESQAAQQAQAPAAPAMTAVEVDVAPAPTVGFMGQKGLTDVIVHEDRITLPAINVTEEFDPNMPSKEMGFVFSEDAMRSGPTPGSFRAAQEVGLPAPGFRSAQEIGVPRGPAYGSFRAAQEQGLEESEESEENQGLENSSFNNAFGNPSAFSGLAGMSTTFSGVEGVSLGNTPNGVENTGPAETSGMFGGVGIGQSAAETAASQMSSLGLEGLFSQGFENPGQYSGVTSNDPSPSSSEDSDDATGPSGPAGPSSAADAAAGVGVDTSTSQDGPGTGNDAPSGGDVSGGGDSAGTGPGGGPSGGGEGGGQGGMGGSGPGGTGEGASESSSGGGWAWRGGHIDETFQGWTDADRDRAILRAILAAERMHSRDRKARGGYVMPFARFADGGEIVENSVEYTPNGVIYSQVVQRALNAAKRRNAA